MILGAIVAGGLDVMIASMNRLISDEALQRIGCGALANLASQSDLVARMLVTAGAIEVAVRSMKVHEGALDIHISGCMLFAALSSMDEGMDEASTRRILEARVVPCVLRALECHAAMRYCRVLRAAR